MPLVSKNRKPIKVPPRIRVDLTGKVFGLLTVLGYSRRKGSVSYWLCECECGNKAEVQHGNLQQGRTQRCLDCHYKFVGAANTKHGMSQNAGYATWSNRRSELCATWRKDFKKFYDECYVDRSGLYLVAIDDSRLIGPDNHKWSDYRADSFGMIIDGKQVPTREAMTMLGISRQRVCQLRNAQNGLCPCGRKPVAGMQSCRRCQSKDAARRRAKRNQNSE